MDKVKELIRKKPPLFLLISCLYLLLAGFFKWYRHPTLDIIWFLSGGAIGIYLLDAAELFFNLTPSPFRSVVFSTLFAMVGLFVITSSGSTLASGVVLSLYLQMILWQVGEWRVVGNLTSWYRMMAAPAPVGTQKIFLMVFGLIFCLETYFFIH